MNDKVQFHKMTKPIRFRRIKVAKSVIVLWFKELRERIIYHFNYLLYKLNILKRYNYTDITEQASPIPENLKPVEREIETEHYKGTVKMVFEEYRFIDIDYFYRIRKDGSKKITYTMKDHQKVFTYAVSRLNNISIRVSNNWYNVSALPTFKVSIHKPQEFDLDGDGFISTSTVTFNITKLIKVTNRQYLGIFERPDSFSKEMIKWYYDKACFELAQQFNDIKLGDITIGE